MEKSKAGLVKVKHFLPLHQTSDLESVEDLIEAARVHLGDKGNWRKNLFPYSWGTTWCAVCAYALRRCRVLLHRVSSENSVFNKARQLAYNTRTEVWMEMVGISDSDEMLKLSNGEMGVVVIS